MPGDVPRAADGGRSDGECTAPDVPGNSSGLCRDAGYGAGNRGLLEARGRTHQTSRNLNESYTVCLIWGPVRIVEGRVLLSDSRLRRVMNSLFADRADAGDILQQGFRDIVSLLQEPWAVVGEPYGSVNILPDERLQGQIEGERWGSDH